MATTTPDIYLCTSDDGDESLFRGHLTRGDCAPDLWVSAAEEVVVEHVYARALPPPDGYSSRYVWPAKPGRGAFAATLARTVYTGVWCDLKLEQRPC